jgi:hypothetical protein
MRPEEAKLTSLDDEEARLRAAIRDDTEGLREAVDELQSAAKQRINLRHAIARSPLVWLGGALAVGWMLGSRIR